MVNDFLFLDIELCTWSLINGHLKLERAIYSYYIQMYHNYKHTALCDGLGVTHLAHTFPST